MVTRKDLIKNLANSNNLAEADNILTSLGASLSMKKLTETAILNRQSPLTAKQQYGTELFRTVIKELTDDEKPAVPGSPGVERKGDKMVQEEELSNHSPSTASTGSHQSTSIDGLPMEGDLEGDADMLEEGGQSQGTDVPEVTVTEMEDEDKKKAVHEIQKYHETVVVPLQKHVMKQNSVINTLSKKIRETEKVVEKDENPGIQETTFPQTENMPQTLQQLINTKTSKVQESKTMDILKMNEYMDKSK